MRAERKLIDKIVDRLKFHSSSVPASLPRQHPDAPINAAAMIAVGDVANGSGPFECVKLEPRQMHAGSNLLTEGIAGRGNFRACPEPVEHAPSCGGARAVAGRIGGSGKC